MQARNFRNLNALGYGDCLADIWFNHFLGGSGGRDCQNHLSSRLDMRWVVVNIWAALTGFRV